MIIACQGHSYRVRQLIQSAHISLNTEAKKIQRTFLTSWEHSLVSKGSDQAQKFWSSLNAASVEANFQLRAEQCI